MRSAQSDLRERLDLRGAWVRKVRWGRLVNQGQQARLEWQVPQVR